MSCSPEGATSLEAVLARLALPPRGGWVLLIDGRSGSGKSTLAGVLADRFGAAVLPMEDLYPGWGGLAAASQALAQRILPALISGRPAAWRRWDWAADRPGEPVWATPARRLIVEGCGALTAPSRRLATAGLVLDVAAEVRRARVLHRDPPESLPGHALWARQEAQAWQRHGLPGLADVVVRGGVRLPPGDPSRTPAPIIGTAQGR